MPEALPNAKTERVRGIGGEAGIRTLRTRVSKLVMARDFWR